MIITLSPKNIVMEINKKEKNMKQKLNIKDIINNAKDELGRAKEIIEMNEETKKHSRIIYVIK